MKFLIIFLLSLVSAISSLGQDSKKSMKPAHGFTAGYKFNTEEKSVIGIGYQILHPSRNHGAWIRYQHRYQLEYIPVQQGWGASVDASYIFFFPKLGMQAGFRKNEQGTDWYISPQLGLDLILFDISIGPAFHSAKYYKENVAFKLSIHVNYPLFNADGYKLKTLRKARSAK